MTGALATFLADANRLADDALGVRTLPGTNLVPFFAGALVRAGFAFMATADFATVFADSFSALWPAAPALATVQRTIMTEKIQVKTLLIKRNLINKLGKLCVLMCHSEVLLLLFLNILLCFKRLCLYYL